MSARIRFGVFEADLTAGELYREGRLVALQQQPFEVLRALVQQPGELVTRDALRQRLWPDGTIVDFDQSLNKSLTKLRDALGDRASNPRFVQTLPKRGYRFIAPVSAAPSPVRAASVAPAPAVTEVVAPPPVATPAPVPESARRGAVLWQWAVVFFALLTVSGAVKTWTSMPAHEGNHMAALKGRPTVSTGDSPLAHGTPIVAARDAYERGRRALARGSERCVRQSVELFRRAVALSPSFAAAHAALAQAFLTVATMTPGDGDLVTSARDAAARAVTLDPKLADGYIALGRIALTHDRDWRLAEEHLQRAIGLDPGSADARVWYAAALSDAGRNEEAEAEARRALAADPHALETNTTMGAVLHRAGRHAEAAAALARAIEIDPDYAPAQRLLQELAQVDAAAPQPIAFLQP